VTDYFQDFENQFYLMLYFLAGTHLCDALIMNHVIKAGILYLLLKENPKIDL